MRRAHVLLVGLVACSSSSSGSSAASRCPTGPTSDVSFQWSMLVEGQAGNVVLAPNGDYVVCGHYGGGGSFAGHSLPAGGDTLVAELSPSGSVVWAQTATIGGSAPPMVAVDEHGDVVLACDTQSTTVSVAGKSFANGSTKYADMTIVVGLSGADGSMRWAQGFIGTDSSDASVAPEAVASHGGRVLVAGSYHLGASFGATQLQASQSAGNGRSAFAAMLGSSDGSVTWVKGLDGTDTGGAAAVGADLSPQGDAYLAIQYGGSVVGLAPAPSPPLLAFGKESIVFAKLSGSDGTPATASWLTLDPSTAQDQLGGSHLVYDATTSRVYFLEQGQGTFGTTRLSAQASLVAMDASLSGQWALDDAGSGTLALAPAGILALTAGTLSQGGGQAEYFGQTLSTTLGPSGTAPLLAGLLDAGTRMMKRAYVVPPTGGVQPGDKGSLRSSGMAASASGQTVVSATLDGVVNLDACGVASDPKGTGWVVFAVAP